LRIIVAENLSTTHHLKIGIDASKSTYIHHSRNSLVTHDNLPPCHRQLIGIIEWINKVGQPGSLHYEYTRRITKDKSESEPPIHTAMNDIHSLR
jgi:hypothetical protein